MNKYLSVVLLLFSSFVHAGGSGGVHYIKAIATNGSGIHDEIVLNEPGADPDNCMGGQIPESYFLLDSNEKYFQIYSLLLAAGSKQKSVTFYLDGCHGGFPVIENARITFL